MASLRFANGSNASTDAAILGDNPAPYCSTILPAAAPNSSYLTSGTLSIGDTGEFGGLAGATVEIWFKAGALPASVRGIVRGPESSVSAGNPEWTVVLNTTGTVAGYYRNSGGTANVATSTTALMPGTWYHLVLAADPTGLTRLYVNGVQEATAGWAGPVSSTSSSATIGDLRVGDTNSDVEMRVDEMATYRRFIGAARIAAHYTAGVQRGYATALPGARVTDILDHSASVHAPRFVMAGFRQVTQSYSAGQPPLDELRKARMAENGSAMIFVSRSGAITFLDFSHRSTAPYNTNTMNLGDRIGELAYQDLAVDYSEAFLVNEWNVTRAQGRKDVSVGQGEMQTASDATSISRYFKRSQSLADVPVVFDTDAADIATTLLAKYKDPMLRGTTVVLDTSDPEVAAAVFRCDLGYQVVLNRTPPGGGARIIQNVFIQQIQVSETNDGKAPVVTLSVSPV